MSEDRPENRWLPLAAWIGRLAVGGIFLFAAGVKALDPVRFAHEIDAYGWLPTGWTHNAALFFIALELLLGTALVLGARPRLAAAGTAVLLLFFVAVLGEAWASGTQLESCGCFGSVAKRTPAQGVGEDLLMLLALAPTLLLRAGGRATGRAAWRVVAAGVVALAGLGLAMAAPSLPIDGLVTDLNPGERIGEIGLDSLVPEQGVALVALLDLQQEPSQFAVAGLNDVAVELLDVNIVALAAAGPEERATFGWTNGAGFAVDEIGAGTIASLARTLPRFALVVDGQIVAVWNHEPPTPDQVREAEGGPET